MILPPPLTPNQFSSAMQQLTLQLLGIDSSADPEAFSKVRIAWPQQGQPAWGIKDNICILMSVEDDDQYNRIRDVKNVQIDSKTVSQITTYVRVWRTTWTIYGPDSFDNARKIRSGLFTQALHDLITADNLAIYLVTDVAAPRRVPELFEGQWWERVDFDCQFNELATESVVVNAVASSEVIVETNKGIVRDITVEVP